MITTHAYRFVTLCLSLALIGLMGCDSSVDANGGASGSATLTGQVTDESGNGKITAMLAGVEGAVVTAATVSADGSLNQLEGQTTTNAQGRFSLEVQTPGDVVVIVAKDGDFESKAIVYVDGRSTVTTMPLTAESHAEADVLVEARRQDEAAAVTMADVAAYVTSEVAGEVHAGSRSAADIASSIRAEVEARTNYVRQEQGNEEAEEARENHNQAFFALQADLDAAADASARADVVEQFEVALIEAYTSAGVHIATQARARQSGRAALVRMGAPTFAMEKQAELMASLAMAHAVDASFESEGASNDRLTALADARADLIAAIRAAGSASAIGEAHASYESEVKTELGAEANVDLSVLETAAAAISTSKTALNAAVSAAGSAAAIANAYVQFYASAQSAIEASLAGATTKASLAADVLAMLSAS
ncbi:MAG: carboxypeptidase-like regulatory domain-containing protein [Rhodothermales bacterium]